MTNRDISEFHQHVNEAKEGKFEAQMMVSYLYNNGFYHNDTPDIDKAIDWAHTARNNSNPAAIKTASYALAKLYAQIDNHRLADKYMLESAHAGNPLAQVVIGNSYNQGHATTDADYTQAASWYAKAIENSAEAALQLAMLTEQKASGMALSEVDQKVTSILGNAMNDCLKPHSDIYHSSGSYAQINVNTVVDNAKSATERATAELEQQAAPYKNMDAALYEKIKDLYRQASTSKNHAIEADYRASVLMILHKGIGAPSLNHLKSISADTSHITIYSGDIHTAKLHTNLELLSSSLSTLDDRNPQGKLQVRDYLAGDITFTHNVFADVEYSMRTLKQVDNALGLQSGMIDLRVDADEFPAYGLLALASARNLLANPTLGTSSASEAERLYLVSARSDNPQTNLDLGKCYLSGNNGRFAQNNSYAVELFDKAAQGGLAEGALLAAKTYLNDPKGTEEALRYLDKASELGITDDLLNLKSQVTSQLVESKSNSSSTQIKKSYGPSM